MLRQYFASPSMGGNNPLRIGTIAVGSVYYIQDDGWWRDRFRGAPICRNPWIVEAFLNGVCAAARRNPDTGRWDDVYLTGRSDVAIVRSLRTGKRQTVTVRTLHLADDEGHHRIWPTYPDHPAAHLVERYLNRGCRREPVRRAPQPMVPEQPASATSAGSCSPIASAATPKPGPSAAR